MRHSAWALKFILLLASPFYLPAAEYRVAAFQVDATPDLGEPNIWTQPVTQVLDPLYVKGIVLDDGAHRYVIAAIDWCGVGGAVHLMLRERIARGAGTDASRVALQSVHQHTAPYVEGDGYVLLKKSGHKALLMSDRYLEKLASRLEGAARDATRNLQVFDTVGTGIGRVERVASARRILKNGGILVRYSSTAKAPELANEPEGDIDPDIRTITLARGTKPLVRLHYYATHPQTFCCDGRVTADFVGAARDRMTQEDGVPQIYFTGCGGNVTVGKYNQGTDEQRAQLADRMLAGMRASIKSTRYETVTRISWRSADLTLPPRNEMSDLAKGESDQNAYRAAIITAFAKRQRPVPASALYLGGVIIVHLPGEPLLEFQRFAQQTAGSRFIAVAGYGDIAPGYICPDEVYGQGGYEPSASNTAPGAEQRVKALIRDLIGAAGPAPRK